MRVREFMFDKAIEPLSPLSHLVAHLAVEAFEKNLTINKLLLLKPECESILSSARFKNLVILMGNISLEALRKEFNS
jgi:hypothetical protein